MPEYKDRLNNGRFKKGFLQKTSANIKGSIPWNKGKHPEYVQKENHL